MTAAGVEPWSAAKCPLTARLGLRNTLSAPMRNLWEFWLFSLRHWLEAQTNTLQGEEGLLGSIDKLDCLLGRASVTWYVVKQARTLPFSNLDARVVVGSTTGLFRELGKTERSCFPSIRPCCDASSY